MVIFPAALPDQSYVPRMRHNHVMAQLGQLPADPRRMRPGFRSHQAARHSAEHLLDRLPGGRQLLFDHHFARFIQHAVVGESISQVHADRQLLLFENLLPSGYHSAILFHKPVTFPLRLERVDPWERIASRWSLAFSSHLRNGGVIGMYGPPQSCKRKMINGSWSAPMYSAF